MKVTLDLNVTDQFLHDVFVTAMEGGVNYWAHVDHYHWSLGAPAYEQDLTQFGATVIDDDTGKRYKINSDVVEKGVRFALNDTKRPAFAAKIAAAILDDEMILDAGEAEELIQYAIFGEVIYG